MSSRSIVIGGGVNELVAAHYLARAGHEVLLLRESAGADEPQLEAGWVPPHVVRDLGLERHGFIVSRAEPWASIALPDADFVHLSQDISRSADAIAKMSSRDAGKWPEFCARMSALSRLLEGIYSAPPPDPMTHALAGYAHLARLGLRVRALGRQGIEDLLRLLPMSAADLLDEWFENDALKGALAGAAVMHLCQGPRSGGTAFNFLHHHVGSAPGVFRPALSNLRRVLLGLRGFEMRTARVAAIVVRSGCATGVILPDGEELAASLVVSGLDPGHTLLELIDPGWLDPELVRAVRRIRHRGVAAEVTLTLDREPPFSTLVVAPSLDYLERAYDDAKYGRDSREPYIEAHYVGQSSDARHELRAHVQYVPYAPAAGDSDESRRDALARLVIDRLSRHAPIFAGSVVEHRVRTPRELEALHGLPEGQPYHAELALDQVLWMRPVPALAQYRTPLRGLYLCGPAMHPGAGIAGAAGANAARVILGDTKSLTAVMK